MTENVTVGFADQLAEQVLRKRSSVCVGLDPRWQSLPEAIRTGIDPGDASRVAAATECYCRETIDAVAEFVPIVKPQAAFFEQLGPHGMVALANVIAYARKAGLLVLLDGKRGDIGTTAEAYADGYLGVNSIWGCDALTVNPYLGDDTLQPFTQTAIARHAGIFVLVKTSNPGSGFLQDLRADGQLIYHRMADQVQSLAAASKGSHGLGAVGAVVGATYPEQLADLRSRMPNTWILIPGYGAQGGTATDVAHGYLANGLGAIVNSSRGIIFAYQLKQYAALSWQKAISQAAIDMTAELNTAIKL